MFRNLKIGKKLIVSFILVSVLASISGLCPCMLYGIQTRNTVMR